MALATGVRSANPVPDPSVNELLTKYLGRDVLSEIPDFDYYRIPMQVLRPADELDGYQPHPAQHLPGGGQNLISLPNEIILGICRRLGLSSRSKLACTCKHLAQIAVTHNLLKLKKGLKLTPKLRKPHSKKSVLHVSHIGHASCDYCKWHGPAFDLYFFRHRKLEWLREGRQWTRGSMVKFGVGRIVSIYNKPIKDLASQAGPDSRENRALVRILGGYAARFDKFVRLVGENTS